MCVWPLPGASICVNHRASDLEFHLKYEMNALFCFTLFAGLFTIAAESTSNVPRSKNCSLKHVSTKDALVVNNATQSFVRKVFERYSNDNGSREITIDDFYGLLAALRIGDVYNVTSTNTAATSPDEHTEGTEEHEDMEKTTSTTDLENKQYTSRTSATHRQKHHKNVSNISSLRACLRELGRYMTLLL